MRRSVLERGIWNRNAAPPPGIEASCDMWSERANPGRRESSGRVERMSVTITGGCHCGLVPFEADLPSPDAEVLECIWSLFAGTGYLPQLVTASAFRIAVELTGTTPT